MTLRQLRALLAIQTQGKIVNAAKALGLTAPAITLQLKQLEEDAGVVLFDRTTQGMRPTAAGLAVIGAASSSAPSRPPSISRRSSSPASSGSIRTSR